MAKTLVISESTHSKLVGIGKKNETFDQVISRLLDFHEQNRQK